MKNLTGEQLFDYYTSINNEYRNTLFMAHIRIGKDLFPLLEKCEKENKAIVLTEEDIDVCDNPMIINTESK